MENENNSGLAANGIQVIIAIILIITITSAVLNKNGYVVKPKIENGQVIIERYDKNGINEQPKGIITILKGLQDSPLKVDISEIRKNLNSFSQEFRKLGDSNDILKVVIDVFYYIQQIAIQLQCVMFMLWNSSMYMLNLITTIIFA